MNERPRKNTDRIAALVDDAHRLELDTERPRVLAIGSQLVHGSVGLNAAEAVYGAAGVRAARVPSIVLSVMPHYESFHHVGIEPEWMTATFNDLDSIGALDEMRIVTAGYLAAPEQAEAIGTWVRGIEPTRQVRFVLDPTLGDTEVGFITDPALADAARKHLAPVATGITPNLFELALLTGVEPRDLTTHEQIASVARSLLNRNTAWIAVTGVTFADDEIGVILVTRDGVSHNPHECVATSAKGLGDTFAAAMVVALLDVHTPRTADLEVAVRAATDAVLRRIR